MSDENIICGAWESCCEPDTPSMGELFFEKMKEHSDNIAQIDGHTGETQTYEELLRRSIIVAQKMQERNLKSGDIITICSHNHLDSCLPFLGALYLGVKIASLDPTLTNGDCVHLLKLVEPKYVFSDEESVELLESAFKDTELETKIVVFGNTEKHIPFSDFLESTGMEENFKPESINIYETAVIFFSSGTTGLPKGICCTHYGLITQQRYLLQGHDTRVFLYFTTFYWISAVMLFIMSMLEGSTRVLCKKFEEQFAMEVIEKYKVTYCFMAPIYTYKLTKHEDLSSFDTTCLKSVVIGGGRLSETQMIALQKLFPHTGIYITYGMTEVSGCCTIFNPLRDKEKMSSRLTSVGTAVAGISYKVVNIETNEICGPNVKGEIMMKGDCLMSGYHNNPTESSKCWDSDNYLHTGDVGYYDEEHCFYVEDRIKDVMKYQSWHIIPAELESILLTHPDVQAAAVVGVPHEIDGEHPMAVIVRKPGSSVSDTDILDYFNGQVSERKKLRGGITFLDSIPHTPSGKLRRRDLRDLLLFNA